MARSFRDLSTHALIDLMADTHINVGILRMKLKTYENDPGAYAKVQKTLEAETKKAREMKELIQQRYEKLMNDCVAYE